MAPTQYDKEDIDRPLVGDDRDFFDHPDIKKMQEDDDFRKWGDELNEGSEKPKEKDSEELQNDEETGGEIDEETSDEQSSVESLQDQADGNYFYDEQRGQYGRRSALRFSFGKKRRRNLILISLAGGLFVGTMGLSILSGPFQLIQFANLLRGFNFSDQENVTNNRLGKIAKYVRYANTPENTRLSVFEKVVADRVETKMNDAGIKSNYNADMRGALAGYDIDVTKFDDPELKRLMDPSTVNQLDFDALEQRYTSIQDHVKTTYGLDLDLNNGFDLTSKTIRTQTNTGYFSNKKLLKNFIQKSGYKSLGGMRARIGIKKAGITLHPIRKVDNAIKQRGLDFVRKHVSDKRTERIKNGADTVSGRPVTADAETDANGNSTVDPQADEAARTAADTTTVPTDADTPAAKKSVISGKIAKAAGIAAIGGIVCAVKGIADNVDEVNHARIVLPLARYSGEFMATGMQLMGAGVEAAAEIALGRTPTIDIDMQQVQLASETLASDEFGSWYNSTEVQAALGKDSPGREIPPEARIDQDGNAVGQFLSGIPGLGGFCDALNSTFGYIATTALSVVLGPVSAVTGEVFMRAFAPAIMNGVISSLAAEEVDLSLGGTTVGSYGMHGGKHAANASMIASGGTALTPEQNVAWQEAHSQDILEQYKDGGFFAQFLNPLDARTSIGSIVAQSSSSPTDNLALMFKTSMKGVASMINPTNLFGAKVKAASIPYDYGFDIYSFGINTLEDPRYEIPQENSKLAVALLNGPSGDSLIDRAKTCFGVRINKDGDVASEGESPSYSAINKSGASCADEAEDWTRIRFHIFDNQTAAAALCYEGDDCSDFGVDENASNGSTSGISSGTYTSGGELSCEGYFKVSPQPAKITNGQPAGSLVPYSADVKQACESLKQSCLAGVSGTVKALCAAFEFHDAFYGSTSLPGRNMEVYGVQAVTNGLHNPEKWYNSRKPGLNGYNMLECSALTMVSVWKAFGNTKAIGCSGSWGSKSHPDLFRQLPTSEIQPGDFLTKNFGCNVATVNQTTTAGGHVAIAASTVSADGKVLVYEQSGYGTTTHFKLMNISYFKGNYSRWIGPGI